MENHHLAVGCVGFQCLFISGLDPLWWPLQLAVFPIFVVWTWIDWFNSSVVPVMIQANTDFWNWFWTTITYLWNLGFLWWTYFWLITFIILSVIFVTVATITGAISITLLYLEMEGKEVSNFVEFVIDTIVDFIINFELRMRQFIAWLIDTAIFFVSSPLAYWDAVIRDSFDGMYD